MQLRILKANGESEWECWPTGSSKYGSQIAQGQRGNSGRLSKTIYGKPNRGNRDNRGRILKSVSDSSDRGKNRGKGQQYRRLQKVPIAGASRECTLFENRGISDPVVPLVL